MPGVDGKHRYAPCCPSGVKCAAEVLSVKRLQDVAPPVDADSDSSFLELPVPGEDSGIPFPSEGVAKLVPYIFGARYHGQQFVYSPASRFSPRALPVVRACSSWITRVRRLIFQQRLPLLMRWDPEGSVA